MKRWIVLLFLPLGLAGCGYTATGNINQIELAIYTPICVDVLDASSAAGANLQIYPCGAGKLSQEWTIEPINNGKNYIFINENSKMCMSVLSPYDTSPGQYVVQQPCVTDGSDLDEVWSITKPPSGEAGERIVNSMSGECLDLPYGETASITTLQQYYCDVDDPAQGWTFNPVAKGNTP
ncbi:MAG TPA: RICIN domain-containing protein [Terracidiphilus sp.]|jgi:hypothetical protein